MEVQFLGRRQGEVTLRSSEAEFVVATHAGQELLSLFILGHCSKVLGKHKRVQLKYGKMSVNPTNRDCSMHIDVKVHSSVWLFIGTQKMLVALHSALIGSRRDGHTARAV
jgi:hypothetical protein